MSTDIKAPVPATAADKAGDHSDVSVAEGKFVESVYEVI
jgi:hypothetical protein